MCSKESTLQVKIEDSRKSYRRKIDKSSKQQTKEKVAGGVKRKIKI